MVQGNLLRGIDIWSGAVDFIYYLIATTNHFVYYCVMCITEKKTYRKVASRSTNYYSESQVFGCATNRGMSLITLIQKFKKFGFQNSFLHGFQNPSLLGFQIILCIGFSFLLWISKVFFVWMDMDFKILLCLDFKSLVVGNQIWIWLVTPHATNSNMLLLKKSSLWGATSWDMSLIQTYFSSRLYGM